MTRTFRNHQISRPKNWQGTRWAYAHAFPCWCGEHIIEGYRLMAPCCFRYLRTLRTEEVRVALAALPRDEPLLRPPG